MIYIGSKLIVSDNSGGKRVKCIKIIKKKELKWGEVGNILLVVIKSLKYKKKVKKKELYKCILVRTKKKILRKNGSSVLFSDNAVILLNNKLVPIATRIFGPLSNELRLKNNLKLVTMASNII